ncbi:MAG: hypothetical protein HC908_11095 [Calothrix sp. SM1_7_51]|nr:hypothetical protein [Calothrix sp. SM1_7_51]
MDLGDASCIEVFFNAMDNCRKRSLISKLDSCDFSWGGISANRTRGAVHLSRFELYWIYKRCREY